MGRRLGLRWGYGRVLRADLVGDAIDDVEQPTHLALSFGARPGYEPDRAPLLGAAELRLHQSPLPGTDLRLVSVPGESAIVTHDDLKWTVLPGELGKFNTQC